MKARRFLPGLLVLCLLSGFTILSVTANDGVVEPESQIATSLSAPLGTGFTYQGELQDSGGPVSGSCDLLFELWSQASGGSQLGSTIDLVGVTFTDGLFTANLDFGASVFQGYARWLEVGVRCPSGSGSYAWLTPRQALTPAPYALYALDASSDHTHLGQEWSSSLRGLTIESTYNDAMHLSAKWTGLAIDSAHDGIRINSAASNGVLVSSAENHAFYADYVVSGDGLRVDEAGDDGVQVHRAGTPSSFYSSSAHNGLEVGGVQGTGVWIGRADADGVRVESAGVHGIRVIETADDGLHIWEPGRDGLRVWNAAVDGVHVFQAGGYAGNFEGDVRVTGILSKGGGSFVIDHPLDPENKYLQHSFVESPDMMNVYNGNVILGADGSAWVNLPDWFEELNFDFRYQLTCIGGFAPVYVAQEIEGNRFQIAGGEQGLKVSWQVTGIRHDPFAEANRILVEVDKPPDEQGIYLHPEAYGLPETEGLVYHLAQEELAQHEAREAGQP